MMDWNQFQCKMYKYSFYILEPQLILNIIEHLCIKNGINKWGKSLLYFLWGVRAFTEAHFV